MSITDLSNLKEHPLYLLGDKVAEICAPLFTNFPINHFNYAIVYPGNKIASLTSDRNWVHHYIQSGHNFVCTGKPINPWSSIMPSRGLEEAANLNHYNGIILDKVFSDDHLECLEFSSPHQDSSPLEFCSNKELLNQFLLYFKGNYSPLFRYAKRGGV